MSDAATSMPHALAASLDDEPIKKFFQARRDAEKLRWNAQQTKEWMDTLVDIICKDRRAVSDNVMSNAPTRTSTERHFPNSAEELQHVASACVI